MLLNRHRIPKRERDASSSIRGRGVVRGVKSFLPSWVEKPRAVLFLELLLATLLISVALVGLLGGFRTVIEANTATCARMTGRLLAERRIAELEKDGVFQPGVFEGEYEEFPGFRWEVHARMTPSPDVFRVQVTVDWRRDSLTQIVYFCRSASGKGGG